MPDKNPKNKNKLKESAEFKHEVTQERKQESPLSKNGNLKNGTEKLPELKKR
jgi:hypothetical protein